MKIIIAFLLTFGLGGTTMATSQDISIPQAPRRVEFADVTVKLTPRAQQIVNAQIKALLTPEGEFLNRKMEKMQWYFPIIEDILEEVGVPDDFKYIAVLESSLEPNAVSTSNAVGFWQFKQPTALEMGLRIDRTIDERKDIFQSTRAAATYLKRNNVVVNNWVSAMLTYNLGTGGVSGQLPTNWSYAREVTFDGDTHPYLVKALAHRIAFEHRINRLSDSDYRFVVYPTQQQSLSDIAKTLVIDPNDLQKYNAWLYANRIPNDRNYNVLIPVNTNQADKLERQINNRQDIAKLDVGFPQLERLTPQDAPATEPIIYQINGRKGVLAQPGDEIPQLAAKGKLGVYKFMKYNDLTEHDEIETGKVYYMRSKARKGKVPYHTVAEGETMWDIAHMYGIRMRNVLKFNRLKNVQRLQAGRIVWLQKKRPKSQPIEIIEEAQSKDTTPLPRKKDIATSSGIERKPKDNPAGSGRSIIDRKQNTDDDIVISESDEQLNKLFEEEKETPSYNTTNRTSTTGSSSARSHFVQRGETLYSISRKYSVSVDDLRKWNNLNASADLQFNQRLIINSSAATSTTPTPAPSRTTTYNTDSDNDTYTTPVTTSSAEYHTVSAGETLYRISKNYGLTVDQIRSLNGLSDNTISVGQRLKVGGSSSASSRSYSQPSSSSSASSYYHTVAAGETLYRISVNNKVSVDQLRAWNNLSDNTISIGQRLLIKK
jgi:membrane-bound lytic murein transglycosylase D